jgi:hypothetical protein
MRILLVLLISAVLQAETPKLPEPYQRIVELSHSVAPEFASDALLRIVESGKIPDRESRSALLEEAFRLAAGTKFDLRMRGVAGTTVDTRSGSLSQAYDLRLDTASLQSRAVIGMLALDRAKGRELLGDMHRPAFAPLSCDEALVYDPTDYYRALAAASGSFSAKEREKDEHLNLLLDHLGQVSSPSQLVPLAWLIKGAATLTAEQRQILWTRFNGILESLQPDGRSFAASVNEIGREITFESGESFEKYRTRNVGCKTDDARGASSSAEATPKLERYWQSADAKRLLEDGKKLRYGPSANALSDAERSTAEWRQQLADYLTEVANWGPASEKSEADYYHQKCLVYESLVDLIPHGAQRNQILDAFVSFIGNSSLQQQSPAEWFSEAKTMLERVRNTSDPAMLMEEFRRSGNPVLALYTAIETTFGSKTPPWATPEK